jgi:dihydroorotase
LNEGQVVLERGANEVPTRLSAGDTEIVPFQAGETLGWKFLG